MDNRMQTLIMWLTLTFLGASLIVFLHGGATYLSAGPKMYNCSLSEISPDFTPAMREECRKLRRTK